MEKDVSAVSVVSDNSIDLDLYLFRLDVGIRIAQHLCQIS